MVVFSLIDFVSYKVGPIWQERNKTKIKTLLKIQMKNTNVIFSNNNNFDMDHTYFRNVVFGRRSVRLSRTGEFSEGGVGRSSLVGSPKKIPNSGGSAGRTRTEIVARRARNRSS